jgi:predicted TIM-barrel fold metal-dependent hydrolase
VSKTIREFVMHHPLFCHHNHHVSFKEFDAGRSGYDHRSLLGYADTDLRTAAGARPERGEDQMPRLAELWPKIRATGYGRAVSLCCRELFDTDYSPENFPEITRALQEAIAGKSASAVFDCFVRERSGTRWVISDAKIDPTDLAAYAEDMHLSYYRFAWRMDHLFAVTDSAAFERLEQGTDTAILALDRLVEAVNVSIDRFKEAGRLQAFKIGMAYGRDLMVADPTRHQAELAFNRICSRKLPCDGVQQESARVNAREGRPLGDYLFHRVMERAHDEDIPVQMHTGYLWGHWGSLPGTNATLLIPIFDKYRRVRFDIFHASWPWTSELGAIAKNYPNVYPDLCWAWAMNPAASERVLSEWIDGTPFNKIFGYGADTGYPWCDVGYAMQARLGIARVLEQKIDANYLSPATAEEVAAAIMLGNGEEFFGLS